MLNPDWLSVVVALPTIGEMEYLGRILRKLSKSKSTWGP